jgi:hypothetical protein
MACCILAAYLIGLLLRPFKRRPDPTAPLAPVASRPAPTRV